MITLKKGSRGFLVKRLQNQLGITADGVFGSGTENAVIDFQKRYGLLVDGIIGWRSWKILLAKNFNQSVATKVTTTSAKNTDPATDIDNYINGLRPLFRLDKRNIEYLKRGISGVLPYADKLDLKNLLEQKIFMSNVREEVGRNITLSENLNYKCSVLPKLFKVYSSNGLARKHGRCDGHSADQIAIANHAYANRYGNDGPSSGDGWRTRGQGGIMTTFTDNYELNKKWADENIPELSEIFANYSNYSHPDYWLLTGAVFWARNSISRKMRSVDSLIKKSRIATGSINKYTHSYEKRIDHLKRIV